VELTNDFSVGVPVDQAWSVLTDLERIAPCLPGAELQEVEGDEYRGIVKVKVGPITAQYKGTATFLERDEANHRAVIRAEGRDTRGQGNANATVTATLVDRDGATHVTVLTDLTITGKVAQFGRGVMADVSSKLMEQFVQALEADVLSGSSPAAAPEPAPSASPTGEPAQARKIDSKPAQPVDLLGTTGLPVAKRVGPVVGVLVVVLWLLRRRKKKK
jgi:carbon monoxide dehydrogenase subunit G